MTIALWAAQILLAAVFLATGTAKLRWSKERLLASGQSGVAPFPLPVLRWTGAAELLAAAGLVLPEATGVVPVLTPLAALGLVLVMTGALWSHSHLLRADRAAGRGLREARNLAVNALVIALCAFIAAGRLH